MGVVKVSNNFTAFSLDSYCEILLLILVITEKIFYVIVLCRHLKHVIYLAPVRPPLPSSPQQAHITVSSSTAFSFKAEKPFRGFKRKAWGPKSAHWTALEDSKENTNVGPLSCKPQPLWLFVLHQSHWATDESLNDRKFLHFFSTYFLQFKESHWQISFICYSNISQSCF